MFCCTGKNRSPKLHTYYTHSAGLESRPSRFVSRSTIYRVAQQCCPGGNRPETPRRPSAGGLRIFWAKSLVIPAIYTKFVSHKLEFCIYGWNYQWFSPKNPETPWGGSPGGLRKISAGTTLLGHTVILIILIPPVPERWAYWAPQASISATLDKSLNPDQCAYERSVVTCPLALGLAECYSR